MKEIIKQLLEFRDKRNWDQFHTPDNLAKSISIEAAELLELYQWGNKDVDINDVKEELADVIIYAILLSEKYDLDIETIIKDKIDKNNKKYPKDKSYGKSDKYTKL